MSAFFLPLILLLGAFLRFYNNTAVALWHDEAFSALYMRYPWSEMIFRIGLDVHPPLYYFILRFWTYVMGQGLLSLRLLSISFGVLTVWAGYLFVKAAFQNQKLALLAALFLAVNPFQIQYSLEARMYTLGTFLSLLSGYLLVRALEHQKFWIWYGIAVAAALYTHYYLLFTIAAQGLFVILYFWKTRNVKTLARAIGAYFLAFVLYVPWVPTLWQQIRRVQQSYWIPPMNRWSIPGTVWKMIFGGQGINRTVLIIASVTTLLIIFYYFKRVKDFSKWLVLFGVLLPFLGAVTLSLKTNIYLDRYFVFASLFFVILVVQAFYQTPRIFWRRVLVTALLAMSLFAFFKNWADLGIKTKPGMAAAAKLVNENVRTGDHIYVASSFIYFTFQYYNQTPIKPLLISNEPLEKIPHFSGTALLSPNDLIMNYAATAKNTAVWLLWTTGFGGSKPEVPTNWRQLDEKGYEDSPGFKGSIIITKYRVN